jgi:hypothetical protein
VKAARHLLEPVDDDIGTLPRHRLLLPRLSQPTFQSHPGPVSTLLAWHSTCVALYLRGTLLARNSTCVALYLRGTLLARNSTCVALYLRGTLLARNSTCEELYSVASLVLYI